MDYGVLTLLNKMAFIKLIGIKAIKLHWSMLKESSNIDSGTMNEDADHFNLTENALSETL